jgi:PTH1 family peptidyl-tRNA hydrolase
VWLFVGLGNPGREYAGTRHNVGFDVVDLFETKLSRSTGWKAGKADYYVAKGWLGQEEILLVKPTTYMNLSGRAVRDAMQFYKVPLANVVIIADDIAIPLGTLRLRMSGSDGGHNGIGSVIYETGTQEFPRLRLGVGADFPRGQQARYVLSPFKESESAERDLMLAKAVDGCRTIVEKGVERAMNIVNVKPA